MDSQDIRETIRVLRAKRRDIGTTFVDIAVKVLSAKLAEIESEPTLDVRRQLATVLFADVSGFTAMSEDLDPEEVRDIMNAVWRRVDGIIVQHAGAIDKHIGDAVMAVFGVPRVMEDDAIRAVRCGLAMQEALADLSALGVSEGRPGLGMRVGIHTGQVVFGEVGTTGERTVLGDTVNLASRLESAAPVGGVLVSDETWQGLRRAFVGVRREPMKVKGKSVPVQTWEVNSESDETMDFVPAGPGPVGEVPLVGRLTELAVLLELAKASFSDGTCRYVTLVGEAGVGKSRLLYEFQRRLEQSGTEFDLYSGRLAQQESRAPYELLRHQLFIRYGIKETDTPAQAVGRMTSKARAFGGENGAAMAAIIGQLIGFDCTDHPAVAKIVGEPLQFRETAFRCVAQMIEASVKKRPAVMLFEDLQWASDASLDLADWLLEHCQHLPILAVHAIRPSLYDRRPDWAVRVKRHLRIEVAPLSPKETRRLAASLLSRVDGANDAGLEKLVRASGGNPFFLEELVRKLFDDGVVVHDEAGWRMLPDRVATMRVPPTLNAVIAARLDTLSRVHRRTLERAAVIGRRFWDEAVQLLDPEDADPSEVLADLVDRDLIRENPTSAVESAREYHFRSALIRDAACERVLLKFRREAHRRAAKWFEERGTTYVQAHVRQIAEHWHRAGEPVASARWRMRAARMAESTGALEDALADVELAERELDAAGDESPVRLEALLSLGELASYGRRFSTAVDAYEKAAILAERQGDDLPRAKALSGLALVARIQGRYRDSIDYAERAVVLADKLGASAVASLALVESGWSRSWTGDHDAARDDGRRALALADEGSENEAKVAALRLLGNLALVECDYEGARARLGEAVTLAKGLNLHLLEGRAHNDYGEYYRLRGEYPEAVERYSLAQAAFRSSGDLDGEYIATSNISGSRLHQGRAEAEQAETDLQRLLGLTDDDWYNACEAPRHLAEALIVLGEGREAVQASNRAWSLAANAESMEDKVPCVATMLDAERVLGTGAADETRAADLKAAFETALEASSVRGMEADRARLLRSYAAWTGWRGDTEQADRKAKEARLAFEALGLTTEADRPALSPAAPPTSAPT